VKLTVLDDEYEGRVILIERMKVRDQGRVCWIVARSFGIDG
jgi:hypothetical protein